MKRANPPAASIRLIQVTSVCAVVFLFSICACAQTPAGVPSAQTRTDADEEFELNIDSRRIGERDFHAETAVETDGARGLRLGVGVALSASDIDVMLLGVRGHVRFRASLAPVLRLLEARRDAMRPAPPTTPAPTPP